MIKDNDTIENVVTLDSNGTIETGCFKVIERQYFDSSKINLSCVFKYIHLEKSSPGRGDRLEGLIARLHVKNHGDILNKYRNLYGNDLYERYVGDYVEIKRHSSMFVPMYCVYYKKKELKELNNVKQYPYMFEAVYDMSEDLFNDFGKNDDLSLIQFKNFKLIKNEICNSVRESFPDKENEIKAYSIEVSYVIPENGYWECREYMGKEFVSVPYELFKKRKTFNKQNEARIIFITDVNVLNLSKLDFLTEIDTSIIAGKLERIPKGRLTLKYQVQVLN